MKLVGYFIVLISFYVVFTSQSNPSHISSISVESGPVHKLAKVVKSLSGFKLDGFSSNGFYRVGDIGKYLSENLLNYIRYGNVDPREDGVIVTVHYSDSLPSLATRDRTVGYLFGNKAFDSDTTASVVAYMKNLHRDKRDGKNGIKEILT